MARARFQILGYVGFSTDKTDPEEDILIEWKEYLQGDESDICTMLMAAMERNEKVRKILITAVDAFNAGLGDEIRSIPP